VANQITSFTSDAVNATAPTTIRSIDLFFAFPVAGIDVVVLSVTTGGDPDEAVCWSGGAELSSRDMVLHFSIGTEILNS
jgi:hypothetical protein